MGNENKSGVPKGFLDTKQTLLKVIYNESKFTVTITNRTILYTIIAALIFTLLNLLLK